MQPSQFEYHNALSGAFLSYPVSLVCNGVEKLAEQFGLIPQNQELEYVTINGLIKQLLPEINMTVTEDYPRCIWQELGRKVAIAKGYSPEEVGALPHLMFVTFAAGSIVLEACSNIFIRHVGQEILLKRLPKACLARFSPRHQALVDSKVAKIARIVIIACIEVWLSSRPNSVIPSSHSNLNALVTGIHSLVKGVLYESQSGLFAMTGYSLGNLLYAGRRLLFGC